MDWSKYPLEKLFSFVAAAIPGFVALSISGKINALLLLYPPLGYRTRVSILVAVAFLVGFTMTSCLSSVLGAIGGAIGAVTYKTPQSYEIAPWRDPEWRELIKKKLGDNFPEDTRPLSKAALELRTNLIGTLPKNRQADEIEKLGQEKLKSDSDDLAWSRWYDHYHMIIVLPNEKDIYLQVHTGLSFSMQTAALYCLLSAIAVPAVRHWWYMAPASFWILLSVLQTVQSLRKALDKWSTLNDQIKYLANN
jgi:hypothetical protein